MAGFERPNGGYTYSYDGLNTVESADHLDPTQYPLAINIRDLPDHHVETRPGYSVLFNIAGVIAVTCPLGSAVADVAYSASIPVSGGTPPYTYSIVSGALPPGLDISSSTGIISGIPTSPGTFNFTIHVTDSTSQHTDEPCSIVVDVPDSACGELYGLWRQNCRVGPFRVDQDQLQVWYGCFVDPDNNHKLIVWKTTDFGETWQIQDDGIFPELTNEIGSFDCQFDRDKNLIFATGELNTARTAFHKFSTDTDTWDVLNEQVKATGDTSAVCVSICQATSGGFEGAINYTTSGPVVIGPIVITDHIICIAYQREKEDATYQRVGMKTRTGVGAWSTEYLLGHWGISGTGFGGQTQGDLLERLIAMRDNRLMLAIKSGPSLAVNSGTDRQMQTIRADGTLQDLSLIAGDMVSFYGPTTYRGGGLANVPWNMGDYSQFADGGPVDVNNWLIVPFGDNGSQFLMLYGDPGNTDFISSQTNGHPYPQPPVMDIKVSAIPSGGNSGFMNTDQFGIKYVSGAHTGLPWSIAYIVRDVGYSHAQVNYRNGVWDGLEASDGTPVYGPWTPSMVGPEDPGDQVGVVDGGTNLGFNAVNFGSRIWVATFNDGLDHSGIMFNLKKQSALPDFDTFTIADWIASCSPMHIYARFTPMIDGRPYSSTMLGVNGAGPYTFAVFSGSLPTGLSLSSSGVLSGILSTAGPFSAVITLTDSLMNVIHQPFHFTVLPAAGPKLVQTKIQNAHDFGGVISFDNNVVSGDLLVVCTNCHPFAGVVAVSDTLGTVYTRIQQAYHDNTSAALFYGFAPSSGPNTVTVVAAGSFEWITAIHEFSRVTGVDTSLTLAVDRSPTPTPTFISSGNITTAASNELLFGLLGAYWNGSTLGTYDASDFLLTFKNGAFALETQFRVPPAETSPMKWTTDNGADYLGIIVVAFTTLP